MTPEKLAYFAGMLDNVGAIRIEKSRGCLRPVILVRSRHRQTLEALVEAFGGRVGTNIERGYNEYFWHRGHSHAKAMLAVLRPYMVQRAAIVDAVLAWEPGKRGRKKAVQKPPKPLPAWNGLLQLAGRGKPLPRISESAKLVEFS